MIAIDPTFLRTSCQRGSTRPSQHAYLVEVRVVQRTGYRRLVGVLAGLDRPLVFPHSQPVAGDDERAPVVIPQSGRYGVVRSMHPVVLEALDAGKQRNCRKLDGFVGGAAISRLQHLFLNTCPAVARHKRDTYPKKIQSGHVTFKTSKVRQSGTCG